MLEIEGILEDLILTPGPSGYEEPVREKIAGLIKDYVDQMEVDNLGNLITTREGDEALGHIAFFAHLDEIGLVTANITPDGFLRFKKIGGIDDHILPSTHVRVLTSQGKEVPGVIACVPPHLLIEEGKIHDKVVPWSEMIIDLGAGKAEEVKAMGVQIGDPIVFAKQISRLANGLIAARGMDNRAGCTVLVSLIRNAKNGKGVKGANKYKGPRFSFVFTTQEEYGLRGAQVAGHYLRPQAAFIIDTASAPDFYGLPSVYKDQFKLGHGPMLRLVDVRMMADRRLRTYVEKIANQNNLPLQAGVVGGSTDAAAVQLAGDGVRVLPVCIPCRYTHSTVEVISIDDLKTTIDLLTHIINKQREDQSL